MAEPHLTRSAYLEASIAAAQTWLSNSYAGYTGSRLKTYMARTTDEFRQIGRVDVNDGNKPNKTETPFALMAIGSIGLDPERAGFKKHRVNRGIQTGVDRQNGISYHDDMRPAVIGLGLAFITDGIDDVFLFAETLLMAAPVVTLSLSSDTGFVAHCSLLIDGEMTIPPPEDSAGNLYRFEIPLRLRTFLGHANEFRLIKRLKVGVVDSDVTSGKEVGNTIYEGDKVDLLRTTFTYQDLFNKDSDVYKYDHTKVGGDNT